MTAMPSPALVPAAAALDRRRYPGVRSFQEPDARRFFGRTRAADELLLRVLSVRLLLQFAPSGAGKTSLLNAGLFPRLRPHNCFPFAVRLNEERESLVQAVERSMRDAVRGSAVRDPEIPTGAADVWTLLTDAQLWTAELRLLTPVLVFDQFEEVFTLRDDAFRKDFARQIGELSRGRREAGHGTGPAPDVKIVISLREEYLGALEEMSAAIPDLFRERLRVSPLTPAEARDAIVEPARLEGEFDSPRFTFDGRCVDELIDFIDGVSDRVRVIEPLTLQLVCQRAEAIATERAKTVPAPELHIEDFGGTAGLEQLVHQYYTAVLAKLPDQSTRRRAVMLFEQGLLDPTGKRLMLEQDEIERRYGLKPAVLHTLVESRLLRREPRNESVFYEISHDRLTEVIARHRTARLPRWVWLALAASVAVIIGLMGVMGFVIYKDIEIDRANRDTAKALHLLLGDTLVARLREAGLSDALAQVLGQTPAASDPLAEVLQYRRAGELAYERDTLQAAEDQYMAALEVLDSPRTSGRHDVAMDAERAQALKDLGDVLTDKGKLSEAAARYEEAKTTWDSVVARENTTEHRLSAAETRTSMAGLADRMGKTADAEAAYLEAAHMALPDLQHAYVHSPDVDSDGAFALGRAEQVFADAALGLSRVWSLPEDLRSACALATELLRLRPLSAQARTQLGTAGAMYAAELVNDGNWQKGRLVFDQASRQFSELVQFDPRNLRMTRELSALRLLTAETLVNCAMVDACRNSMKVGEIEAAESTANDATGTFRSLSAHDKANTSLQSDIVWGLMTQASLMRVRKAYTDALRVVDHALELTGTPDQADADGRNTVVLLDVTKLQLLMDARRLPEALTLADRTLAAAQELPEGSSLRQFRLLDALFFKSEILKMSGRAAEATQVRAEFDALSKATDTLKFARSRRANAANKEGNTLFEQANKVSGPQRLDGLDRSTAKYDAAIRDDLFQPVFWSNRAGSCAQIAYALSSEDQATQVATNTAANARLESANRCAVESRWMAWVLSDDGTGAATARNTKALGDLYKARRSLAMFLRDHNAADEALNLAQQGVREAELNARVQPESADNLFLLADANYGLGLMRAEKKIDGWEQAIRAALVYGERLAVVANTTKNHVWLGQARYELAALLADLQRGDEATAEREHAMRDCLQAVLVAKTDDERRDALGCAGPARN